MLLLAGMMRYVSSAYLTTELQELLRLQVYQVAWPKPANCWSLISDIIDFVSVYPPCNSNVLENSLAMRPVYNQMIMQWSVLWEEFINVERTGELTDSKHCLVLMTHLLTVTFNLSLVILMNALMNEWTDYDGKKLDDSGVEAVPDDLSPNNSQSENSDYIPARTGLSVCPYRSIMTNCKHVFDKTCISEKVETFCFCLKAVISEGVWYRDLLMRGTSSTMLQWYKQVKAVLW